jgi:hypothetical protein
MLMSYRRALNNIAYLSLQNEGYGTSPLREGRYDTKLGFEGDKIESSNIQNVLLQEIKEKLYGKEVKARVQSCLYMTSCGFSQANYNFLIYYIQKNTAFN